MGSATLDRVDADVVGPSVGGQPVVHITGFVVLVLVTFTGTWAGSLVTVAHEGGHVVVGVLTGRYNGRFRVNETTGGGATAADTSWGAGAILSTAAGYLTPPLVGLAGANLVLDGQSWSLLWAAWSCSSVRISRRVTCSPSWW